MIVMSATSRVVKTVARRSVSFLTSGYEERYGMNFADDLELGPLTARSARDQDGVPSNRCNGNTREGDLL